MSDRSGLSGPLHIRQFRLLFAGQVVSNLGDWLDFLALVVLIAYIWHDGPSALAALAVVVAVPWILVAPFMGPLADRWPKKRIMIGCDLARAAVVFGLIFAPNLAVLLVLVGIKTLFSTLFSPAEEADHPLHRAERRAAHGQRPVALRRPGHQGDGSRHRRPAGGAHAAHGWRSASTPSPSWPRPPSSASCGRSRPTAASGRDDQEEDEEGDEEDELGYWQELREGITHILSRRALMIGIFGMAAATFLLVAFDTLSPLAFIQLGASKAVFGVAIASVGLGGVVGAILVGRYGGETNPFVLMGASEVLVGGLVALVGYGLLAHLGLPPLVWAPVLLVVGLAAAGVLIAAPTIMQRETPPEMMGRVSASAEPRCPPCSRSSPRSWGRRSPRGAASGSCSPWPAAAWPCSAW